MNTLQILFIIVSGLMPAISVYFLVTDKRSKPCADYWYFGGWCTIGLGAAIAGLVCLLTGMEW